jgi:hypothetical protein
MRATLAGLAAGALLLGAPPARAADECPHHEHHHGPAPEGSGLDDDDRDHHHHHARSGRSVSLGIDLFSIEREAAEQRIAVLDVLFVHGFRMRSTPDSHRVDVLKVPFVSLYGSRRKGAESELRLLDLPLVELFTHERDEKGTDTRLLDLPLVGSLYRSRVDQKERRTDVLFLIHLRSPVESPPTPEPSGP